MADKRTQLETVIQTAIDSALKELHTCLPAVVTKFDAATQLIDCQLTIKRKMSGGLVLLPLLVGVPVRYFKSATFSVTFPLEIGDHVMVIFSERSIDTWLAYGGIQDPFDLRKHSLSDAFAIPMMYHQGDVIPGFSTSNLEIKTNSGSTKIIVKNDGVEISTSGPTDITSSLTTINNNVVINGTLQTTGTITAPELDGGGVSYTSHIHSQPADSDGDAEQDTGGPHA